MLLQTWLEALDAHSAYSTHYCSQEQGSEEDEEDDGTSLEGLKESLRVSSSVAGPSPPTAHRAASLHVPSPLLSPNQAAEASHRKLEEETAAFLVLLKNDGLAESNMFHLLV